MEKKLSRAKLDAVLVAMNEFFNGKDLDDDERSDVYKRAWTLSKELFGDEISGIGLLNVISGINLLTGELGRADEVLELLGWRVENEPSEC